MAKTAKKSISFEDNLARIESLVTELERPAVPLEQAIAYYEEGISLIQTCQKLLTEAEQKITILNDARKWLATLESGRKSATAA